MCERERERDGERLVDTSLSVCGENAVAIWFFTRHGPTVCVCVCDVEWRHCLLDAKDPEVARTKLGGCSLGNANANSGQDMVHEYGYGYVTACVDSQVTASDGSQLQPTVHSSSRQNETISLEGGSLR